MNEQDIIAIVDKAVEKATSKSDALLIEERRRSNYIRASQGGQFRTRAGIFEYFRAYEGLSAEEALKLTDLECLGRGIGEDGQAPAKNPTKMAQIQDEALGFVLNSLKNDPIGTFQTAGQIIGGAVSLGAGYIGGTVASEDPYNPAPPTQTDGTPIESEEPINIKDL